ncbi:MAG TPA: hypothetical protein VFY85_14085 [Gemmatimonadaceae bacterium]|nr:hypothetical protein [Gemmatimonadaceae bacterium]
MRKLLIGLLVVVGACTTRTTVIPATPSPTTTSSVGQRSPREALATFLSAANAQDLQAMSAVWGDKDGSVRSSGKMGREEIEKREIIMMCYLKHDRYRVVSESPAVDNERVLAVELTKGKLSRTAGFNMATDGPRWYVRSADLEALRDLCAEKR